MVSQKAGDMLTAFSKDDHLLIFREVFFLLFLPDVYSMVQLHSWTFLSSTCNTLNAFWKSVDNSSQHEMLANGVVMVWMGITNILGITGMFVGFHLVAYTIFVPPNTFIVIQYLLLQYSPVISWLILR